MERNDMPTSTPSIADRVNKLFEVNRAAAEPEDSPVVVAAALTGAIGRPVDAKRIDDLRSGSAPDRHDMELLKELALYFDAPRSYLSEHWDFEASQYDGELSLLANLRDNGVQMLAMRDGSNTSATELIEILEQLPGQPPHTQDKKDGTGSNI
jgi:hypothetical protein